MLKRVSHESAKAQHLIMGDYLLIVSLDTFLHLNKFNELIAEMR